MAPAPDARIAAVILAGGKGERLGGVIKANIRIGGARLLDRVAAVLSEGASPVLIAHGPIEPGRLGLGDGHVAVADAEGFGGPLAGLAGAAAWCRALKEPPDLLVCAAVDTPFLPPDFVGLMLSALEQDTDSVIAGYDGQPYPTNALWRVAALVGLPEGRGGIRHLVAARRTRLLDWPFSPAGDPFANLNTEADRMMLEARAVGGAVVYPPPSARENGVGKAGQTR